MAFLTLVNKRLDEVKQRLSYEHYMDTVYHAKRWIKRWTGLSCSEVTIELITKLRDDRSKISNQTANKELRYLRSLFNWGIHKGYVTENQAHKVEMMRVEKKAIYMPSKEDIDKVIAVASKEQGDYLWCLRDTLARSREINNLRWEDIDFEKRTITLYTRKKRYGTKTPRTIPMTNQLFSVLKSRYQKLRSQIPWVFSHKYYSMIEKTLIVGPFKDRKKFMHSLCKKAGVKYFRFHPLRHAGASLLESINTPITEIQGILGHENRKTTEGYIHSMDVTRIDVIRRYEQAR
jgi:integrase